MVVSVDTLEFIQTLETVRDVRWYNVYSLEFDTVKPWVTILEAYNVDLLQQTQSFFTLDILEGLFVDIIQVSQSFNWVQLKVDVNVLPLEQYMVFDKVYTDPDLFYALDYQLKILKELPINIHFKYDTEHLFNNSSSKVVVHMYEEHLDKKSGLPIGLF